MKKTILTVTLFFFLMAASYPVQAQQGRIGVGAMLGTPNGLSIKGWISNDMAIDGGLSFTLGENSSSFYLHSNVLFHRDLGDKGFNVEEGRLDFYYGAGIRLQWLDIINDIYTGIRGPTGISYRFEESPAGIFFELVPTIDIHPAFRFMFSGAIGARYYLN